VKDDNMGKTELERIMEKSVVAYFKIRTEHNHAYKKKKKNGWSGLRRKFEIPQY